MFGRQVLPLVDPNGGAVNMAAKSHADSSVSERRLRPIYDWLDTGNNKKALQEADKVLKKQPNFQCAKVLKALALLRLGRTEESQPILAELQSEAPTDDNTLQAMTICYRELNCLDKICQLYEAAVKKEPGSEDLLTHLFVACVRVGDYRRQQQVAMSLYKLKNKNPYYFWAVMSVVMQASQVSPQVAQSVTLPLAERMVRKLVDEKRMEAEQEVHLYLMVLRMQGKFQEALDVLDGPLGTLIKSPEPSVPLIRADHLTRLGRWGQLQQLYSDLLREDPDQWSLYKSLFDTIFRLMEEEKEPERLEEKIEKEERKEEEERHPALVTVINFVLELCNQEEQTATKKNRGPYLARIELHKQLQERGRHERKLLGELPELVSEYMLQFGSKPCCFSDLRPYLLVLDGVQQEHFLQKAKAAMELEDGQSPSSLTQLYRHICYLQLNRFMGRHETLSPAEKVSLARELVRHFETTGSGSLWEGKKLLSTEFRPNDPYALLAVHLLHDAWQEERSSQGNHRMHREALIESALILERALSLSPSNFTLRMPLVKIYQQMGAGSTAAHTHQGLDIKHVQLDAMGYLLLRHLASLGHLRTAEEHMVATLRFFAASHKDVADHIVSAYKFGSFAKIEEFVKFRDRLAKSQHLALVTAEKMVLDLVADTSNYGEVVQMATSMELDPAEDKIAWGDLQDNRDLQVMVSWAPPYRQTSSSMVKESFDADTVFLNLQMLTLRCLAAALALPSYSSSSGGGSGITNGIEGNAEVGESGTHVSQLLSSLLEELRRKLNEAETTGLAKEPTYPLQGPHPSRVHLFLHMHVLQPVVALLQLCICTQRALSEGGTGRAEKEVEAAAKEALSAANQMHSSVQALSDGLGSEAVTEVGLRCGFLERVFNLTEAVGLSAIVCGVVQLILRPVKTSQPRKGKRRRERDSTIPVLLPVAIETFNNITSVLQTVATELETTVQKFQSSVAVHDMTQELETSLHLREVLSWKRGGEGGGDKEDQSLLFAVLDKMSESYQGTAKELGRVLQLKAKFLKGIRV